MARSWREPRGVASEIATAAPVEVRALKQTMTFGTEDAMEGIRAIQERRRPTFQGR